MGTVTDPDPTRAAIEDATARLMTKCLWIGFVTGFSVPTVGGLMFWILR